MAKETNGTIQNVPSPQSNVPDIGILPYMVVNDSSLYDALARRLGIPTAGQIDMVKECRWIETPTIDDYDYLYRRFGYAKRTVNILPDESWKEHPEIYDEEEADETTFEKALKYLIDKKQLFNYLKRIDRLSGVGSFGGFLIGLAGKDLGQPAYDVGDESEVEGAYVTLAEPNEQEPKPELAAIDREVEDKGPDVDEDAASEGGFAGLKNLLYMRPLSEKCLKIQVFETRKNHPRYGLPKFYQVTIGYDATRVIGTGSNALQQETLTVHWTHIVHIVDNVEDSEVFGAPRMEAPLDRIMDLRKVLGGSSEMFWRGGFPGFSFETPPDQENVNVDIPSIRDAMEKYAASMQRYIFAMGGTVKMLAPQIADATTQVEILLNEIATTLGIPLRIFMGSEQAQLASEQDRITHRERIQERRINHVTPCIIRAVIDRLIKVGVLPEPKDNGYHVEWPDPSTPTKIEQVDYAQRWVAVMTQFLQAGLGAYIDPTLFFTSIMGMELEEVEELITKLDELTKGILQDETNPSAEEEGLAQESSDQPKGQTPQPAV